MPRPRTNLKESPYDIALRFMAKEYGPKPNMQRASNFFGEDPEQKWDERLGIATDAISFAIREIKIDKPKQ